MSTQRMRVKLWGEVRGTPKAPRGISSVAPMSEGPAVFVRARYSDSNALDKAAVRARRIRAGTLSSEKEEKTEVQVDRKNGVITVLPKE